VVKACVENGTSHVDIAGESDLCEQMQLKYNTAAENAGVYIVAACGYDSIPCDVGLNFVMQNMPGDVCSVETYTEFIRGPRGTKINYGTYQTMIYMFANRSNAGRVRQQLYTTKLPDPNYKPAKHNGIFYHEPTSGYCVPNASSDKDVVARSQYFNYQRRSWRPFEVNLYLKVRGIGEALGLGLFVVNFAMWSSTKCGRKAMLKYPGFFGFGLFTGPNDSPTREQLAETKLVYWFFARGWSEKLPVEQEHTTPPDQLLVARVDGTDPGYAVTATSIVACAMTILEEKDKMPNNGGVIPPGAAFYGTSLISRLHARGLTFKLVDGPRRVSE